MTSDADKIVLLPFCELITRNIVKCTQYPFPALRCPFRHSLEVDPFDNAVLGFDTALEIKILPDPNICQYFLQFCPIIGNERPKEVLFVPGYIPVIITE